jgi:hypothetical protein
VHGLSLSPVRLAADGEWVLDQLCHRGRAYSAADRELIGHVEDALSAGSPTIAPPAPSSAVPSVNATFTTSRGSFTIAEVRGGYFTLRPEDASYSDIPAVSGVTGAIPSNYTLEAWNSIRALAAASPDIARCAITMSNARPPADVSSQDSMAALRAPVGDIVICRFHDNGVRWILVEKSAGLATIAPVAHPRQLIPFIPFSVLRVAARTADSAPLPVDAPRVDFVSFAAGAASTHAVAPLPAAMRSIARPADASPLRPGCTCGPSRLPRQLHDEACPLSA